MPEQEQLIRIADVAADCGIRKGYAHRIVTRLGIKTHKRKSSERHGQSESCISAKDVERVRSEISEVRAIRKPPSQDGPSPTSPESGVFYLIQLEPEFDPGRFKVGFSSNMYERLRALRCAAPYLKEVKTWPCKSRWERTAIDCVTQECEQMGVEVFRADDIDTVVERSDEFFGRMPEAS